MDLFCPQTAEHAMQRQPQWYLGKGAFEELSPLHAVRPACLGTPFTCAESITGAGAHTGPAGTECVRVAVSLSKARQGDRSLLS